MAAVLATVLVIALSGCGRQSILSTHSPQAHNIMLLWWWMLAAAVIVFAGAVALLVLAYFRRGTAGLPFVGEREDINQGMVLMFGIALPAVVLIALFGVANVYLIKQTSPPSPRSTALTVDVIGHQFWWEVRYPGTRVITANEIHIPARTRVDVVATTADVIHSFWVPALNRKVDMVPGRRNRVLLYASQPGTYRGQCSQFCGFQHAHMSFQVVAEPSAAFRSWLAAAGAPAAGGGAATTGGPATSGSPGGASPAATGASVATGRQLFMTRQCASCHRIAGTAAQGFIGPDLTHLASRHWLAALTIPNTPRWLTAWIANPQAIKPGSRMPDLGLPRSEIAALVAYLETLR